MPKCTENLVDPNELTLLSKVVAFLICQRFIQERKQKANMKDGEEMLRKVYRFACGKRATNKSELEEKLKRELSALTITHDIEVNGKDPGALRLLLSIDNWFFGPNFAENMEMLSTQKKPTVPDLVTLFKTISDKYNKNSKDPAFKIIGENYRFEKFHPNKDYRNLWLKLLKTQLQTLEKFGLSVQGSAAQGQGAPVNVFSPENAYARPESPVPNGPGAVTEERIIFSTVKKPLPDEDPQENLELWSRLLPPAQTVAWT